MFLLNQIKNNEKTSIPIKLYKLYDLIDEKVILKVSYSGDEKK